MVMKRSDDSAKRNFPNDAKNVISGFDFDRGKGSCNKEFFAGFMEGNG